MNTQIKKLIDKVGMDTSGKWMNIDNVELFAQFIVQECAKIADGDWADPGHQIKQHFDIE
jgi:hypothetical protein